MIAYRIEALFSEPVLKIDSESISSRAKENALERLNKALLDIFERERSFWVQVMEIDEDASTLRAFVAYAAQEVETGGIDVNADFQRVWSCLQLQAGAELALIEEISVSEFDRYAYDTYYDSRIREARSEIFFSDFLKRAHDFKVSDRVVSADRGVRNKTSAKAAVRKILPDSSMMQEIDRVFCKDHPKESFYGIPVHYKISVKDDLIADEMIDFLVNCLYLNKRLLSRRVTKIENIECFIRSGEEFPKLFKCSQNSVVEIVLSGDIATEQEYASRYHQVSDLIAKYIKEFSGNSLFFFVENSSHPGFARQLLAKVDEELDIIEIKEGFGNVNQASAYFRRLAEKSNMRDFMGHFRKADIFESGKFYSASEIRTSFNKWRKTQLKERVYNAYSSSQTLTIDKSIKKKGAAFDELQSMAGLREVKGIIKDIIAAYKVQKLRDKYYDSRDSVTRHMIFTGNPGTAKTSVARLLTEILKENGIVKTGAFIECGRAELVGKYVGWTAQIVKEKFRHAEGGILFIDEAYSLVESGGQFGDEAINTIVQEMENKRGDVIVIFAGYPEKMKQFLEKNEGLRSRIAFHVNFPDYSPDELMEILEKILRDKRYTMTPQAKARARQIFKQVYTQDEFGNGRFVRNMFEQAVNRQAARISEMTEEEISREKLFELREADLDVNIVRQYDKKQKRTIGFAS